jgi:hypothetical protein
MREREEGEGAEGGATGEIASRDRSSSFTSGAMNIARLITSGRDSGVRGFRVGQLS